MSSVLRRLILGLTLLVADGAIAADALWHIVQYCLQPAISDYCNVCPSPLSTANCPASNSCRTSTKVWDQAGSYVTILDRKACGCPAGYVHDLVLPLQRALGIEEATNAKGLWNYAWEQASKRIADPAAIALVVNSSDYRSENQLHIHLVRLRVGARAAVERKSVKIATLDDVWDAAQKQAEAINLRGAYGILIARAPDSKFFMLVENSPLESVYTIYRCDQ